MTNKTVNRIADRLFQLESGASIQTNYWTGECTHVKRIPLKQIVIAILEHLELELDGKPSILRKPAQEIE